LINEISGYIHVDILLFEEIKKNLKSVRWCPVAKENISARAYFYGGRRGRDRMVIGLTTTCVISAYHH